MSNNDETTASEEILEDVTGGDCKNTCVCTRKCTQTKVICADGSESEDGGDAEY